jgi:hypothetical protein
LADEERLQRLNQLRATFAHFNPQGWSIELKLLLLLMPSALNAVEHLLTTQNRVQVQLTEEQKKRIGEALAETRAALKAFDQKSAAAG